MKYTKFFLWALLALAQCLPARGQDETPEPEEKRHWEVGIDLLPLINKETLPAASVFGRYHFTTPAGREMALRLRVGGNSSATDSSGLLFDGKFNEQMSTIWFLRAGVEWRKSISKRFLVYIGGDLGYHYSSEKVEGLRFFPFSTDPLPFYTEVTASDLQGHLITGFVFFIHKNVSLSFEPTFSLAFNTGARKSEFAGSETTTTNFSTFNLLVNPLQVLNLSIHI